ncbi:hypothetical protein ER308_00080 [Egibacter rhizosphaerae]|uniref:Uncharacterized protein n=1 Tax=Egibacter rhizosphaerae TaxID=1670831 RepID=A0A411YA91_9ACTN|nr:hypothetical protein [Egibacter rhizosphaerae]QBI18124.1 hypothetical protein ER308_00080 [Egibacter rhizosphaerae]
MLATSLVLVAVGGAVLVAGIVFASADLVVLSVAAALAAGGLLALGVARHRPGLRASAPVWSGASERPERPQEPAQALGVEGRSSDAPSPTGPAGSRPSSDPEQGARSRGGQSPDAGPGT